MNTLVIAEHDNQQLKPATLNAIKAAETLPGETTVVVLGKGCQGVALAVAQCAGVTKVLLGEGDLLAHPIAEAWCPTLAKLVPQYSAVLVPSTTFGKNLLPRLAALVDTAPLTDVISIESENTFVRPIYAGNVLATVQCNEAIKMMTIRTTAFEKVAAAGGNASVDTCEVVDPEGPVPEFVTLEESQSERPELTSASVVISGGRGLQSQENFKMIESLADQLNAAIGASRAAVDAGFVPNDYQVGQTGKAVAPDLYIAIGISGAIQHLAGMKDSKVIVAINKDPDAPIFQIADYGLVGDLFQVVPELIEKLKGLQQAS